MFNEWVILHFCVLQMYVTFLGAIMTIFQQFYEPNIFGVTRKSRKLWLWEAQFIRVLRIQWLFVCLFVFVLFHCFLLDTLIWKLVHTGQSICTSIWKLQMKQRSNIYYKTIHTTTKRQSKHTALSNLETLMFRKCWI